MDYQRTYAGTAFVVVTVLLSGVLFASAGSARAHACTADVDEAVADDCSAECKAGEDHAHTRTHHHENGLGDDKTHTHYQCTSKANEDDGDCETPRVAGFCLIDQDVSALPGALLHAVRTTVGRGEGTPCRTMMVPPVVPLPGLC